jgi:predicted nuclease of predicted toxin-antitoxin system
VKFLVDNQLPQALAEHLCRRGHDCQHVLDAGLSGASDIAICRYAEAQERILITKDEDFLYLSNQPKSKIRLVWIRLGNCPTPVLLAAPVYFPPLTASGPPSNLALLPETKS